jgi:hypothetical protein
MRIWKRWSHQALGFVGFGAPGRNRAGMKRFAPSIVVGALWSVAMSVVVLAPTPVRAQVDSNGNLCGTQFVDGHFQFLGPCNTAPGRPATSEPNFYTALALSQRTGDVGDSWRALSRAQAEKLALESCRQGRGHPTDCRVIDWAENSCLVYVRSPGGAWEVADGSNPFDAVNHARAKCRDGSGGTTCTPVAWPCSNSGPQPGIFAGIFGPVNPSGNLRR